MIDFTVDTLKARIGGLYAISKAMEDPGYGNEDLKKVYLEAQSSFSFFLRDFLELVMKDDIKSLEESINELKNK